jgi:hypothetical protein
MNDILRPYYNIPEELRQLKQFVLWRYEDIGAAKPTKVPYSVSGEMANVNNPDTWTTFDGALASRFSYSGIGFVFSENDPYTFIDLDDPLGDPTVTERQLKIFREFDSYAEVSPSGIGLHIIIRGQIPQGRRRSKIELYSSGRYATMTGNVYNSAPIRDHQDKLTMLYEQMGAGTPQTIQYNGNAPELATDVAIVDMAKGAVNGDKFNLLYKGHWQDLYQSQSEADLALINMFAFYTQNETQIARMFRQSPLGARPKAKRNDYVNWMIRKSFDQMLPPIDIDGFKVALEQFRTKPKQIENITVPVSVNEHMVPAIPTYYKSTISLPPGLMGVIAQFIYDSSPRQVPEIAIAGAIGLMAGICGKAYNISGTGLNQYVILIAQTGAGKETMASGIDKLMNSVKLQVPTSAGFLGPAEIASGQALVKYINTHPCFVSILGEFGIRLQSISNPHANGSEKNLLRIMLDLYNKSGHHQSFRPSIYSDKEKNISETRAPAFTILAESTPETFYNVLNEDMVSAGLLPRFLIIEYKGKVPYLNENAINVEPNFQLVDQFSSLCAQSESIMHANRVVNVQCNEAADKLLRQYQIFATDKVNANDKDFIRQLWNRAHMKTLKISALIAVGVNPIEPVVTPEYVQWAMELVSNDIRVLSSRFEMGEIGANTGELKQLDEMKRMIREYYNNPEVITKYKVPQKLYDDKILTGSYLNRRLVAQASFKNDKMGSTIAIKRCISTLCDADTIREIGKMELGSKYGTTQKSYVLKDLSLLRE